MVLAWAPLHNPWVQLCLSIPVYAVGLWFFGKSGYYSLRTGIANMDVLIFIGAAASLGYSLYGTFAQAASHHVHEYLFYETGASIICFVLLGNLLEKRSVKKTTASLESLGKLQVKMATLLTEHDGHIHQKQVPVELLKKGDILQVNAGDVVPLDAVVAVGEADCDESLVSGESLPVSKGVGDTVTGGSLVLNGNIRIAVSSLLQQSTLSQIIDMVKQAQASKPAIQKVGDKVSAIFVPVVLGIALLTFIVSYFALDLGSTQSMLRAVAVLVISCPCAMGLATPTAIMVGIGKAARRGIIIKGGDVLENFARSSTIIFDKTGTLTTGEFEAGQFMVFDIDEAYARNLIFNIEQHSSHPIAKSLVMHYPGWYTGAVKFSSVSEVRGQGMQAVLEDGTSVSFGSNRGEIKAETGADLFLMLNQKLVATLVINDALKPGAVELASYFKQAGVKTVLLSGDQHRKVEQVRQALHLDVALAAQRPSQKLNYIEEQARLEPIVMVGDGINDAPALSKVPVGISFSKASDIAVQAANVVITRADLDALREAHLLSRLTYRTIKQNLFWAFFYNICCIPLAAAGFLHPMLGALSMAFSDVIVIGNSLLLGIKKVDRLHNSQ